MKYVIALASALLSSAALAGNTGVIPDGPDSFLIMRTGKTGFVSSSSLQKKAYEEASSFCQAKSLVMQTISMESQRARPFGGFPEATLRFRCVGKDGTAAQAPLPQPSPNDKYAQLERIKALLDSGALTQDEFDREKAKILGQ